MATGGAKHPTFRTARAQRTVRPQTPVHPSNMHPPKQPIDPQNSFVASKPPVFLGGFFLWLPITLRGFWGVLFLEAS